VLGADSAVAAPAPVPCSGVGGGKYECDWWRPGDGRDGGAIVVSDGKVVGYLHQGRNWITCQEKGADVYNEDGNKNRWYGWTQSDFGGWGWASALDAKGGDDNGKFEDAPSCKGKHGPAPGTGGLWGTQPPRGDSEPPSESPPPRRSEPKDRLTAPVLLRSDEECVHRGKDGNQERTVKFGGTHLSREAGGPAPPTGVPYAKWDSSEDFRVGNVEIRAATCETRRGWAIMRPVSVVVDSSSRSFSNVTGDEYRWGLGMWHRRKKSPRHYLNVMFVQCWKNESAKHLGKFLDLVPLLETGKDGLDLLLDTAKTVGLEFMSDSAEDRRCIGFGTHEIKLLVNSGGRIVVAPGTNRARTFNETQSGWHHRFEIKRRPQIAGNP
jgi:hypothetical protein